MSEVSVQPLRWWMWRLRRQCAAVHSECFPEYGSSVRWLRAKTFDPASYLFVMRDGNQVIAYTLFWEANGFPSRTNAEMDELAVTSERQGQGMGSELVIASIRLLEDKLYSEGRGIGVVSFNTSILKKGFYEKLFKIKAKGENTDPKVPKNDQVYFYASRKEIKHILNPVFEEEPWWKRLLAFFSKPKMLPELSQAHDRQ